MKKFLNALCWMGVIALCAISFVSAYTQEEISAYNWAYKNGITTQSTIDAANLNGKLTRQELSKMLTNYIENVAWARQTSYSSCSFTDEDKITPNLKPYTKKICSYKIMGNNGQDFRPTSKVTRAELGTTISRMLWGDRYEVGWKDFYVYHLNALKDQWIMNNLDNPTKSLARRWDTFIMLKRISDRYGSNINLNGWSYNYSGNESNISTSYENANVIYEWQDGTRYYYDGKFLKGLKTVAEKKWETELTDYLKIETKYYENGLGQLESIDLDNLPELLGIDEDLDPDTMTAKEKQALLKKIKDAINKLIKETKTINNEYVDNLKKVTRNIDDDKFWLKNKYEKTKEFIDVTNNFLDLYSEIIIKLMEMALTANEEEIDDEEWMAIVFWLMWSALMYQSESEEYQSYVEDWARDTLKLLWGETSSSNIKFESSPSRTNSSQWRARDVARKNDLAQIQTAIITSQQDYGFYPGVSEYDSDKWWTKWSVNWMKIDDLSTELYKAWMSSIPRDPVSSSLVYWLWELYGTKTTAKNNWAMWDYIYVVSTRNWVRDAWFTVMAKTETEWWSNRVVCKNGQWLDDWYITHSTDLAKIKTCQTITKWNTCSSNNYECTYTDEEELRFILLY